MICGIESEQFQRWIIKVDGDENIVVSLSHKKFQALSQDEEKFSLWVGGSSPRQCENSSLREVIRFN